MSAKLTLGKLIMVNVKYVVGAVILQIVQWE